ncbi:MAG: hypothetical protein JWN50_137 [Parcubacteria group bacterium]|nr:hypothetical protein [Parcubacteria group bacterium]
MRSFEIPRALFDSLRTSEASDISRLSGTLLIASAALPGHPEAVIIWEEEYPVCKFKLFLSGFNREFPRDNFPELTLSAMHGAPHLEAPLSFLEDEPGKSILDRAIELYRNCDDYRHTRNPKTGFAEIPI